MENKERILDKISDFIDNIEDYGVDSPDYIVILIEMLNFFDDNLDDYGWVKENSALLRNEKIDKLI